MWTAVSAFIWGSSCHHWLCLQHGYVLLVVVFASWFLECQSSRLREGHFTTSCLIVMLASYFQKSTTMEFLIFPALNNISLIPIFLCIIFSFLEGTFPSFLLALFQCKFACLPMSWSGWLRLVIIILWCIHYFSTNLFIFQEIYLCQFDTWWRCPRWLCYTLPFLKSEHYDQ